MIVRIEYEAGRTTLFDTLSFTEGVAVLRREHAHGVRARDAGGAREGALTHGDLAPGARWLARRRASGRHPCGVQVARVALHAGLGGRARARPPRPARRQRGVCPGAGIPVRRGLYRRLLPRARGPSLKTAEVADKGAAARAGEGGGPGRARRAGEAARAREGRGRRRGRPQGQVVDLLAHLDASFGAVSI